MEKKNVIMILGLLCVILFLAVIGLSIALGIIDNENNGGQCPTRMMRSKAEEATQQGYAPLPHPMEPLSPAEYSDIAARLTAQFSLVPVSEVTGPRSDYIFAIDLKQVPKAEYLSWKQQGSTASLLPDRYAIAYVMHGSIQEANKYSVGPLPWAEGTSSITLLAKLPFYKRPNPPIETALFEDLISAFMAEIEPLLVASYGTNYDGLTWTDSAPRGYSDAPRRTWVEFTHYAEGFYVLPLGLEILIDHSAMDVADWAIVQIAYNLATYPDAASLLAAWQSDPAFPLIDFPLPEGFASFNRRFATDPSSVLPGEQLDPPTHLNAAGHRFSLTGPVVEHLGWRFVLGRQLQGGVAVYDVTFDGEPIAYELSQKAATALYSGRQAFQENSQYEDSGWGMGVSQYSLLPGVDCPSSALFLSTTVFMATDGPAKRSNNMCLFEQDMASTSMRHYDRGLDGNLAWAAGVAQTRLVLRFVNTVYNYDYINTYGFNVDGTIEVLTQASGYMQAARWKDHGDDPYGCRVGEQVMGSLHDHFILHRVDIDVAGQANSVEKRSVRYQVIPELQFMPPSKLSRAIDVETLQTETDALYTYNPSAGTSLRFVNADQLNAWGNHRGYNLYLNSPYTPQLPEEIEFFPSFSWLTHSLFVTRHKETELSPVESFFEQIAPDQPIFEFRTFYEDDEPIVQQDLVAWIVVGNLHIPISEDIPTTTMPGAGVGFTLRPANFFDRTVLDRYSQRVTVVANPDNLDKSQFIDKVSHGDCVQQFPTLKNYPGSNE